MAEAGLPEFAIPNWYGLDGPPGMPSAVVQRINAALRAVLTDPEVVRRLTDAGYEIAPSSPQEYAAQVKSSYEYWSRAAAGMTFQ